MRERRFGKHVVAGSGCKLLGVARSRRWIRLRKPAEHGAERLIELVPPQLSAAYESEYFIEAGVGQLGGQPFNDADPGSPHNPCGRFSGKRISGRLQDFRVRVAALVFRERPRDSHKSLGATVGLLKRKRYQTGAGQ
jgi:hypothetical protein